MAVLRLKEITGEGAVIHADSGRGSDYTLCGYAYEGSAMRDEGDTTLVLVERGKINCPNCLQIIRYAKTIPARMLAKPAS
jgi:hypothetical protein